MNMTMTLMLIRNGDIVDNDNNDGGGGGGNGDGGGDVGGPDGGGRGGDGGEPVTHEVEVERKLMCQLDSHCHLMDNHHHGTENLNLSRKNGSMIEIGNIQSLLKCSNPQMLKCSNVQILKY